MNRLPLAKRVQILHLLVEGSSMRAASRITGCSINTVTKLLEDQGHSKALGMVSGSASPSAGLQSGQRLRLGD